MVILPSIRRKYMSRRNPGGKVPLGDAVITLDKDVWQYTGSAITPTPVVTLYGNLLTVNEDFTIGYTGNVNVGQGVVTVTGIGQYDGQRQKSFVIEAAPVPSGWQDFDLARTEYVGSAEIRDVGATYEANQPINVYCLQVLDNGCLHFGAQKQGHAYTWGFEGGHPFEVEHFNPTFTSRSPALAMFKNSFMKYDGTMVFDGGSVGAIYAIKRRMLSIANDLSSAGAGSIVAEFATIPYRFFFSTDGLKFFYKGLTSDNLYGYDLATAWDLSTRGESRTLNLASSGWGTLGNAEPRSFFFSKDGSSMVITYCGGNLGQSWCKRIDLSVPWDIGSALTFRSEFLFAITDVTPDAVAINDTGTKMIVFNSYNSKFREYNLKLAS